MSQSSPLFLSQFSAQSPVFNAYLQTRTGQSSGVIPEWQVGFNVQLPTHIVNNQTPYLGPFLSSENLPSFTQLKASMYTYTYRSSVPSSNDITVTYDAGAPNTKRTVCAFGSCTTSGQDPRPPSITITVPAGLTISFDSLINDNGTTPTWTFPGGTYRVDVPNNQIASTPSAVITKDGQQIGNSDATLDGILLTDQISGTGVFTNYSAPGNPDIGGQFRLAVLIRCTYQADTDGIDLTGYNETVASRVVNTSNSVPFFLFEGVTFNGFVVDPFFISVDGSARVQIPGGVQYERIVPFLNQFFTQGILQYDRDVTNTFLLGSPSVSEKTKIQYGSYITLARAENNGWEPALSSTKANNKDKNSPTMQFFSNTLWKIQDGSNSSLTGDVVITNDRLFSFQSAPTNDVKAIGSSYLSSELRGKWAPSMFGTVDQCERWTLSKVNDSDPNLYLFDKILIQSPPGQQVCTYRGQYMIPSPSKDDPRPQMSSSQQPWQVVSSTPIPPSYLQIPSNSVVYFSLPSTNLTTPDNTPLVYLSYTPVYKKQNEPIAPPSMQPFGSPQIAWRVVFANPGQTGVLRYGDQIRLQSTQTGEYLSATKASGFTPSMKPGTGDCEVWILGGSSPETERARIPLIYGDIVYLQTKAAAKNCDGQGNGQRYLKGDCAGTPSPCLESSRSTGWFIQKAAT